jgi:outer membrane protein insertion porin family
MIVGNAEVLFPLVREAGIKGLIFFDIGNAYEESEDFFERPLRMGYGFGFRWFSPIGPLRFEWGYPIDRRDWERSSVFEFSIGTFF